MVTGSQSFTLPFFPFSHTFFAGRKTDLADAQWLAILARAGLLRGGFVPPEDLRALRLISRQMRKLTGILSGEKNRLHKVLTDSEVRLGVVVSDIHGKSGQQMIKGLLRGETPEQVLRFANKRLKATKEELLDALAGELTEAHCFVIYKILNYIEDLERRINIFLAELLRGLKSRQAALQLL